MRASISRPRGLLEAHIAERRLLLIAGATSRGPRQSRRKRRPPYPLACASQLPSCANAPARPAISILYCRPATLIVSGPGLSFEDTISRRDSLRAIAFEIRAAILDERRDRSLVPAADAPGRAVAHHAHDILHARHVSARRHHARHHRRSHLHHSSHALLANFAGHPLHHRGELLHHGSKLLHHRSKLSHLIARALELRMRRGGGEGN